jgi:hypothetical protein
MNLQLPNGASLERTDAVIDQVSTMLPSGPTVRPYNRVQQVIARHDATGLLHKRRRQIILSARQATSWMSADGR